MRHGRCCRTRPRPGRSGPGPAGPSSGTRGSRRPPWPSAIGSAWEALLSRVDGTGDSSPFGDGKRTMLGGRADLGHEETAALATLPPDETAAFVRLTDRQTPGLLLR